jgi:enoyl-CoA hydratase/carnithine racemase
MSFTGRRVGAQEAARIGLILEHLPLSRLSARVEHLSEQIAAIHPGSIVAYKALYWGSQVLGLDDGLALEAGYRSPRRVSGDARTPFAVT